MKWLPALCKHCIAKLWMVGIVVLVLIALLVSAIRGALPYVNQYQPQLSQMLHERYDINLSMGSVKGSWYDGGPLLVIDNLNFDNIDTVGVNVNVKSAKLHIDLLGSVLALQARFKLIELDTPKIHLGDLSKYNVPTSVDTENTLVIPLINLTQSAKVTNATLIFSEYYGAIPDINIAKVAWYDAITHRQLQLYLTDDNQSQQPLSVVVEVQGDTTDTLRGQVYANANQWAWLDSLKPMLPSFKQNAKGVASFELWADFSAGQLDSMMLALGDNTLSWRDHNESKELSIAPELVQWLPYQAGWIFEAKAIKPSLNGSALSSIDVYINQNNQQITASIESLDLADLMAVSSVLSTINDDSSSTIEQLNITGKLQQLSVQYHNKKWQYEGRLSQFSMNNVGALPGLNQLNGQFSGLDGDGQIALEMIDQAFDFGPVFIEPIAVNKFNSVINWHTGAHQLVIQSTSTQFTNKDATSNLSWQLVFDDDSSPQLMLLGDARFMDIKRTKYYLPHVVLSDSLVNYLSEAIKGGHSNDVALLWHGAFDRFPYQNHDGTFEIMARVDNASFKFHDDWKALTEASVDLHFQNETMTITGIEGKLGNLSFESLTTSIDNLMVNPTLFVKARIEQPQSKLNTFVFASPIDNSLGPVLRQLDISGDINTLLDIKLPLDGSLPTVSGVVKLKNNDLSVKAIDLDIKKLNGDVKFFGGDISAEDLKGVLFDQPVTFALDSKPVGDFYGVEIDLSANWHTNKMPALWQQYLNPYMDGSLDWQGKLTLKINDDDVYYQSFVKSPMTGLELKLPKPLDKYVDQEEDLLITSSGNIAGGLFNLALGSRAEVFARIDSQNSEVKISALTLLVGRKFEVQDDIATNGMTINIDLDTLALDEWENFIANIEKGQSKDAFFPALQRVNARVKQLSLVGQSFDTVNLSGRKALDHWEVDFDSIQGNGVLKFFDNFVEKGISANFERLIIEKSQQSESEKVATLESLRNLPPLSFNCVKCEVLDVDLGIVSFKTKPHLQGIVIDNIHVRANATTLDAKVIWGFDSQGEYSTVEGNLNSDDIESTLALLDYSSSIRESNVKTDFDLMWRSSIYSPDIESLSGNLNWKLGEGHIAEVSDQGARIFSLFSLDSLRRKLVLDFRDVFQKGIFFNDFKGNFDINEGVAVTTDAFMDGVAGGVDVVGSVNLSTHELDYYVSFSPKLFSNIPVIAGVVASQPQVFILAFAITKVLEPIVDVISQVNFKLSGTVDKPDFVEIDRKQKKYKVPPHILEKTSPTPPENSPIQGAKISNEQRQVNSITTSL
jgi:uncharacterized protein (TIGR02099 family)